jgi:cell wall-associated NlpC family hydrolase
VLVKFFRVMVFLFILVSAGTVTCAAAYHQGDQGEDISSIQAQLNAIGYDVGAVDGDFGEATLNAVKAFQRDKGLDADGVIGMQTYRAIMDRDMPVVSRGDSSSTVRRVIQAALRYQGVPYVFGGTTPNGFDCSGFTRYVFAQAGVYLPRAADEQYESGQAVSYSHLQPGDTVFFTTYEAGASHSGIYVGDGQFISATSSRGVTIDRLDNGYWGARFLGARRVL